MIWECDDGLDMDSLSLRGTGTRPPYRAVHVVLGNR